MLNQTAKQTIDKFNSFIGVPRSKLPWLSKRGSMLDCAAAVSYVLKQTPEIISCGVWVEKFKKNKTWHTSGVPQPGDVVVFDWETGKGMGKGNVNHDHVGIVIKASKLRVVYVSADFGKKQLVTKSFSSYKSILGYGRPAYKA
jgi:hypothetical protein